MDVRSGVGHTLKDEDFFQDNKARVVELSLSGTLHNDAGHLILLRNIVNDYSKAHFHLAMLLKETGSAIS